MSLKELLKEKREEILSIATKYGASNVRIFGSVARGEDTADSDVDFLVELEPGRNLLDRIALMQDLEDLLERKVDVATVKGLRKYFRDRILNEAVPLRQMTGFI
jgi:predicted nucleotidyltransferase